MALREADNPVQSDLSRERLDETRPRMLKSIHRQMERALKGSMGEAEFVRNMEINLKTFGWWGVSNIGNPQGLRTIFRTNMTTATAHRRYRQQVSNVNSRPYWAYRAIQDKHTRPAHAAMDGRVYRANDPIWLSHYPPNGFNCRCYVSALTADDIEEQGLTLHDSDGDLIRIIQEAGVNKRTGESIKVEGVRYDWTDGKGRTHIITPGPGWSYNPGQSDTTFDLLSTLDRTLQMLEMLETAPPCG